MRSDSGGVKAARLTSAGPAMGRVGTAEVSLAVELLPRKTIECLTCCSAAPVLASNLSLIVRTGWNLWSTSAGLRLRPELPWTRQWRQNTKKYSRGGGEGKKKKKFLPFRNQVVFFRY